MICCGWYMLHMIAIMAYCIHCYIFHKSFALLPIYDSCCS